MGGGLGSNIMEGYVQELPSNVTTFIELLEDICAASDPHSTDPINANEQYNKSLILGLFSLSPSIRNRCCLTLQGLSLGLNTQNYRFIAGLNTTSMFPSFGEITSSNTMANTIDIPKHGSIGNSFKFADMKKLGEIAFGVDNITSTVLLIKSNSDTINRQSLDHHLISSNIDSSIRISALRQLQQMLSDNLVVMYSKSSSSKASSSSSPNLTVSLTLEYDWCVALISLTLVALRDIRLRLDYSGTSTAHHSNVEILTLSVESTNMIRLLMLTIPSLRRKIRLTLIEEKELGLGLDRGLSVHPLLAILTSPQFNANANANDNTSTVTELENDAWAKLQLSIAHLLYLLVTDVEGWKASSNTPNELQQIFTNTTTNTNQFMVPSFLRAFMNDIENAYSNNNTNTNPMPTYGLISCIHKSNKNSSISKVSSSSQSSKYLTLVLSLSLSS
jgi:hypothetical protein